MKHKLLKLLFTLAAVLTLQTVNAQCPIFISGGTYPSQNCGDVQLHGIVTSPPGSFSASWISAGGGTFTPNSGDLNAVYHPSNSDLSSGNIHLQLVVFVISSPCPPVPNPFTVVVNIPITPTNDGNPCTIDACNSSTGIVSHSPGQDGIPGSTDNDTCTTDICLGGSSFHIPLGSIDDRNACTIDACNSVSGAISHSNALNGSVGESDGNICTNDVCQNGTTVHVAPSNFTGQFFGLNQPIPDNSPIGATSTLIASGFTAVANTAADLSIFVEVGFGHTFVGDLKFELTTPGGTTVLFDRLGVPQSGTGNPMDLTGTYTFEVSAPTALPEINTGGVIPPGSYKPSDSLGVPHNFSGITFPVSAVGTWKLRAIDLFLGDVGTIIRWGFTIRPSADDNNPCTMDFCSSSTGISHIPVANGTPGPSDNTVCTADICMNGLPVHIPNPSIEDHNICTIDGCNSLTGFISHAPVPNGTPGEPDGNSCTNDVCQFGATQHIPVPGSDDFNPCTIDACDSSGNVLSHTPYSVSVNAVVSSPILCFNGTGCVSLTSSGGIAPYTPDSSICGIGPGAGQTFTVTDANGCAGVSNPVSFTSPPKLEVTATSTAAYCASGGTATAFPTGGTPGYQYIWGDGQTTQTATGLAPGSYVLAVLDSNGCSATTTVFIDDSTAVDSLIILPPIIGPRVVCKGKCFTYSIPPVVGAISYQWILPAGTTGSSSGNSITVCFKSKFNAPGTICVKVNFGCISLFSCLTVTPVFNIPAAPCPILGPTNVCLPADSIVNYCASAVANATSYQWTIGGNSNPPLQIISGQGTLCITVKVPAGYNGSQKIQVKAVNCKGTSNKCEIDIHAPKALNQPGPINGPITVCKTQTKGYSIGNVSGATSYFWFSNDSTCGTIVSGQGTKSVTINFSTCSSPTVVINVFAINACGISTIRSITINVSAACRTAEESIEAISENIENIVVFPNPTSGKSTLSFTTTSEDNYNLKVINMLGEIIISEDMHLSDGLHTKEINLENVSKGIYLVSIQSENTDTKTIRIVVE